MLLGARLRPVVAAKRPSHRPGTTAAARLPQRSDTGVEGAAVCFRIPVSGESFFPSSDTNARRRRARRRRLESCKGCRTLIGIIFGTAIAVGEEASFSEFADRREKGSEH